VSQVYHFIANNYEDGDELFFFGFSRGAWAVRSVAGLICDVGILSAAHMSRFPELWEAYRSNTSGESFKKSTWYLNNKHTIGSKDVRIKVIGVWDTVGELGVPEWPLVRQLQSVGINVNQSHGFYNTKLSPSGYRSEEACFAQYTDFSSLDVDCAFQALAIDEKRLTFPPT
jgi:uncharacterized protein (DUF2235 family)